MATFMSPPPAATYLAFHPQDNNIVAVGMNDSTIHIYNVRIHYDTLILIKVKIKEVGHVLSCCRLRATLQVTLKESLALPSQMC